MSAKIIQMYRKAGLTPPKGRRGIHTRKYHSCIVQCAIGHGRKIKGKGFSCWAICMSALGKKKAVRKGHRR